MHKTSHFKVVRQAGFTVVELMVVIAIIAIIAGIAIPNMRRLLLANAVTAAHNEVLASVQLARMEAVRQGTNVTVCPSTDGAACGGSDWKRTIVRTSAGVVLRELILKAGSYSVTSKGGMSFTYSPSGFNSSGDGWISACTTGLSSMNRKFVLVGVGRVASKSGTYASCTGDP